MSDMQVAKKPNGVVTLLGSAAFILMTFITYRDMTALETGRVSSVSINVIIKILYELGGKWAAVVPLGVTAIFLGVRGIRRFGEERRTLRKLEGRE